MLEMNLDHRNASELIHHPDTDAVMRIFARRRTRIMIIRDPNGLCHFWLEHANIPFPMHGRSEEALLALAKRFDLKIVPTTKGWIQCSPASSVA